MIAVAVFCIALGKFLSVSKKIYPCEIYSKRLGLVSAQTYNKDTCGLRPLKPDGEKDFDKIVGGNESLPGDWPWSVSYHFYSRSELSHVLPSVLCDYVEVIFAVVH